MKPRLRFFGGIWSCITYYVRRPAGEIERMRMGYGYDPQAAYADWLRQA